MTNKLSGDKTAGLFELYAKMGLRQQPDNL